MKKRPDGRYQKRIPYRENGLLRYRYVYGKSLQEVNRKEREVLKELDQVKSPAIETAVNDYLNHLSGSAPVNTYKAAKYNLKRFKDYFGGDVMLADVSPSNMQSFLNYLSEKRYAVTTIRLVKSSVSNFYAYCNVKNPDILNPCSSIRIPSGAKPARKVDAPTLDQLKEVERTKKVVRHWEIPYLLLFSGLRFSEACALRFEDVENGQILVRRAMTSGGIENHVKTAAGVRSVPVLPQLEPLLSAKTSGFVLGHGNVPLQLQNARVRFNSWREKSGIDITPHQLRHGFATLCYYAGVDAKTCASWLGHKSITTTLDIYTSLDKSAELSDVEKLKAYIEKKL